MDHSQPAYIDTRQAAQHLGLSFRTLEKFRFTGQGPKFYKLGRRCLYRREDLDAWASENARTSTSDMGRCA